MTLIVAGLQPRTTYEAGRIRTGDKDEKGKPRRTDGFRLTSHSEKAVTRAAELYDGYDLRPWGRQWEVYTRLRNMEVALPPGKLVISQAMMRYTGGGPSVVCNGKRTSKPAIGPCQCPQPDDPDDEESLWRAAAERRRRAAFKVPAGCYPYTWVNVMLPDIDGFGVWTLLSKSERAASEIVQQAQLLEMYRAAGEFCPAEVALEYHESRADGMLLQYNVPVIRVGKSLRKVAEELGGGSLAAQLPPPRERIAITTGTTAAPVPPGALATGGVVPGEVVGTEIADGEIVGEWLDAALASAVTFSDEGTWRTLWRESAAKARAGEIAPADAGRIQELIKVRRADLHAEATALDPEDSWALKVGDLTGEPEAADALGELEGLRQAGTVDPARAARVRAAILARFPGVAA